MSDTTQGAVAPDENALFNEAVNADTLAKFENPPPLPDTPAPPPPTPEPKPGDPPKDDNAPVPPGRLREEAELRRRAERERDALQARIDALMTRQPQAPQPQQPDLLDNPAEFVRGLVMPTIEQRDAFFLAQLEGQSKKAAVRHYGQEKVDAAFTALAQGMRSGDPVIKRAYEEIMASPDRYGDMVEWHQQSEILRSVGNDPEAYRKRILEEALTDPEHRKRVMESLKGQAAASGNTVARPVVASSPSLGNIGAAGGDPQLVEPSDAELFRAATTAKRR